MWRRRFREGAATMHVVAFTTTGSPGKPLVGASRERGGGLRVSVKRLCLYDLGLDRCVGMPNHTAPRRLLALADGGVVWASSGVGFRLFLGELKSLHRGRTGNRVVDGLRSGAGPWRPTKFDGLRTGPLNSLGLGAAFSPGKGRLVCQSLKFYSANKKRRVLERRSTPYFLDNI